MNIVVIGDGKVGYAITEHLSKEGHDITVIDKNEEVLKRSNNFQDVICVCGNAVSYEVLMEANVPEADLVIACTSADELNMLACLLAKKHGAKKTIARVRNPEYYEQLKYVKDDLGLSMTINPELSAAEEIERVLLFPSAIKIEKFAKDKVELMEFKIIENSELENRKLSEIYSRYQIKLLICAVQRKNDIFIPDGNFVLRKGDKINIVATHEELVKFLKVIGNFKNKVKTVMIIGGGKISYYLTMRLQEVGMNVKIIEKDMDACETFLKFIPGANIICGDGTDQELLIEEGIKDVDAFVALTGIDEENIIMSMYAKSENVDKVVTKLSLSQLLLMADNFDLDSIVSPKAVTANTIVSYVRAMSNSVGTKVKTVYKLINNKIQVVEFLVDEKSKVTDIKLKDLETKQHVLVACIVRSRKIIIPSGEDTIQVGDNVLIVTTDTNLQDINQIVV